MSQLTRAEQEVVFSKCADEATWCATASDPVYVRRLRKIAAAAGLPVRELDAHTIRGYLPVRCVRGTMPRIVSEGQREHGRRLAESRQQKTAFLPNSGKIILESADMKPSTRPSAHTRKGGPA